jgi:hypothetical protein
MRTRQAGPRRPAETQETQDRASDPPPPRTADDHVARTLSPLELALRYAADAPGFLERFAWLSVAGRIERRHREESRRDADDSRAMHFVATLLELVLRRSSVADRVACDSPDAAGRRRPKPSR